MRATTIGRRGRSFVLRLIWLVGIRVVPFTFVPVSARVPACQQTARRWGRQDPLRVVEPLAVWTLSLCSPDLAGYGLLIREVVPRCPEGRRDTPDLGGRRRAKTRRSDG